MIKKITLIAIASFAISNLFAQMNAVIYSEAGEKFTLYLNGEAMNSAPQTNVKLQGLTSEFYQARVDFQDPALADFSNNNFALHTGMEVTYQVKKNKKGEYVLRYYTENPISSAATNKEDSNNDLKDFAVVDDAPANTIQTQTSSNTAVVGNSKTTTTTTVAGTNASKSTSNGGNVGMNVNVDGVNMGMNVNVNETTDASGGSVGMNVNADGVNFGMNVTVNETNATSSDENVAMNINVDGMNMGINMNVQDAEIQSSGTTTTTTTTTTTRTTTSSSSNSTVPAHTTRPSEPSNNQPSNTTAVGNGRCARSMDAVSFSKAKQTIESKGFDDTRLSTAKQVAKANCLTSDQILQIIKIFGFEDSRLEFAKYAYDFCFDQNNYYNVSQGFSFDSSTEELNSYLESK
jgi:hypothetical protein